MKEKIIASKWLVFAMAILTPIIGVALFMVRYHVGISEISIPCSEWNDELFYYKMIEGILEYGRPQGYFGFNESHAMVGNLGAWSFAVLLPYVAVGKIFGWTYITPVIVNIVLWVCVFALWVWALKPSLKQQTFVSIAWLCYAINIRYIFSVTPESIVTILFLIFAIAVFKIAKESNRIGWVICADVTLVYLTLMRGYYALFVLLVIAVLYNKEKKISKKLIAQMATILLAVIAFVVIIHYCTAAYFDPVINPEWLIHPKSFVKHNLIEFIESIKYIWQAITLNSMRGSWYILYLTVLGFIISRCIKNKDLTDYTLLVTWCILIISMWTLYNAKETSRHLMAYCLVGIMFIAYSEHNKLCSYAIVAILLYTTWFSKDDFFLKLQPKDEVQMEAISEGNEKLSELLSISDNPWDNTVIDTRITLFNDMYALPAGFSLNTCIDDYIREHFDELNSKYIAYRTEGPLHDFLEERCEVVTTYGETVIYQIR